MKAVLIKEQLNPNQLGLIQATDVLSEGQTIVLLTEDPEKSDRHTTLVQNEVSSNGNDNVL
jgi:hypothetical protein